MSDGNVVLLLGKGCLGRELEGALSIRGWHVETRSLSGGLDIADSSALRREILRTDPKLIINAAGCIDYAADPLVMIRANTVGPHLLASIAPCPVIHISSDCVFKMHATRWRRDTDDPNPDPLSMYSVTKAAGEIPSHHLVIRTSFVGESSRMWRDVVKAIETHTQYFGWEETGWSGSYVGIVASLIASKAVADALDGRIGVVHAALSEPVAKIQIAQKIACVDGGDLRLRRTAGPPGRVLVPTAGYELSGDW